MSTWAEQTRDQLRAIVGDQTPLDTSSEEIKATINERLVAALEANKTFLSISTPTSVQIGAQMKALTRQINGVIRLAIQQLDSAD